MAFSAPPESSTSPGKLMMIGWATPTVEPLAGTILGGPKGAAPVNGVGSCPPAGPASAGAANGGGIGGPAGGATTPGSPGAGSGSASAGPALSTSTQPTIDATPAAFRAVQRLPLVQPDIYIPPAAFWNSLPWRPGHAFDGGSRVPEVDECRSSLTFASRIRWADSSARSG